MALQLSNNSGYVYAVAIVLITTVIGISIGVMPVAAQENTVDLGFEPSEDSIKQNTEKTYNIVIEGATNGIDAYQFRIESGDAELAKITDVELVAYGGGITTINVSEDGSKVFIQEATLDQEGPLDQEFVFANVTIKTTNETGKTSISFDNQVKITDNDNEAYDITSGTLSLEIRNETVGQGNDTVSDETKDGTPGFGVPVSLIVLVTVTVLLMRRG